MFNLVFKLYGLYRQSTDTSIILCNKLDHQCRKYGTCTCPLILIVGYEYEGNDMTVQHASHSSSKLYDKTLVKTDLIVTENKTINGLFWIFTLVKLQLVASYAV